MSDTDDKPKEHQPSIMVPWAFHREELEPVVPDHDPLIRPSRVDMADDHYALDITRVSCLAGNQPTILSTSFPLSSRLNADLIGAVRG